MKFEIVKDKKDSDSDKSDKQEVVLNIEKPQWTLDEIALSQDTISQIEEMIAYIQYREKLLYEWEFNRFLKAGNGLSINFFGPPGTGKSITAEAIAHTLQTNIAKVNYGEVESEFPGKTSKNLTALFKQADETKSLLFFDEADALLSKRIANLSQAADHGVNTAKSTLLTLLDKFNGVIVFATNLFDNYDEAFLRRIIFNVEFPVPDKAMRTKLWEFHLSPKIPRSLGYERAAEISDGLCGGDIKNITIKLGLKLLAGKAAEINESTMLEEIKRYKAVKERHDKQSIKEVKVEMTNSNLSDRE